jgi:acetolactate synthase I/II/III large subunit
VSRLASLGVTQAFTTPGGASMYLTEALRKESRIRTVAVHHEQAAAMAAEGFARVNIRPALVLTTAGPGAINAINGVFGAYTDSVPMIVVSGQAKTAHLRNSAELRKLRQLGDQEVDICQMVAGITKLAHEVAIGECADCVGIRLFQKAILGRPGPTWLSVPLDIQNQVSPECLDSHSTGVQVLDDIDINIQVTELVDMLEGSSRPVVLLGSGLRNNNGRAAVKRLSEETSLPVQLAWSAIDLLGADAKSFAGRPSTVGDRAGGLIHSSSDLILAVATSLPIRQVGFESNRDYANTTLVQVDIDHDLAVRPWPPITKFIQSDAAIFVEKLVDSLIERGLAHRHSEWLERVRSIVKIYRRERSWSVRGQTMNPYLALAKIPNYSPKDSIFVCGDASASVMFFQVADLEQNQLSFTNGGSASMGYEIPASLGASMSGRPVVCLAGDGSIQQNIQELTTIAYHKLDVRIVVIENGGYLSIRASQQNHFGEAFLESPATGLGFPDLIQVASGMGFTAEECNNLGELKRFLRNNGPSLAILRVDPSIEFHPRVGTIRNEDGTLSSGSIGAMLPQIGSAEQSRVRQILGIPSGN